MSETLHDGTQVLDSDQWLGSPLADAARSRGFKSIVFEPNPKSSPGVAPHLCVTPGCNVVAYDLAYCKRHSGKPDSEPPAADDNLPKAKPGTDRFVGHEYQYGLGSLSYHDPCNICGGSFFARQHRLRIDTCVSCRHPIIDGIDHPECIAKLSAEEQAERARLVDPGPKADPTKPRHYKDLTPEPIDVIENWGLGFSEGNAVKYLARAGRKVGETRVDDLKKARWYVERALAAAEKAGSR